MCTLACLYLGNPLGLRYVCMHICMRNCVCVHLYLLWWGVMLHIYEKDKEMRKDLPILENVKPYPTSFVIRNGVRHAVEIMARDWVYCRYPHKYRSTSVRVFVWVPVQLRALRGRCFLCGPSSFWPVGPSCCELTWAEQTVEMKNVVLMWIGRKCETRCHQNLQQLQHQK